MTKQNVNCPYPFSQVTITPTGKFKLCCSSSEAFGPISDFNGNIDFDITKYTIKEFWNSDYMEWVRDQHTKNNPIKECESCFSYERCGNESYRQRAIRELGSIKEKKLFPISLDLKLGNACNASCLFCDPSSSSRILSEWKSIGWDKAPPFKTGLSGWVNSELFNINYKWAENPSFWQQLNEISPEVTNLKFTGGEPLINKYMMIYLKDLIDKGLASNIRLQVTTNGISVPDKFIYYTRYFKEVEINFSVDGVGKQNEYIRYPTKWDAWLKNVRKTEESITKNTSLHFQHSLSVYSVFGLEDLLKWVWEQKSFGFHLFKVFHPEFQQPELLDKGEKKLVIKKLEKLINTFNKDKKNERDEHVIKEVTGIVNQLKKQEDKSHLKEELKAFIKKIDDHRGVSIKDYMPEAALSLNI